MNNPVLDSLCESIYNKKTKQYFKEVLSSYYAENYRATIVLLYSIAICDLVFKIEELISVYGNEKAKGVWRKIQQMQANNPKSPEWELVLVKEMHEKHMVIDAESRTNLEALQGIRNLCAHPVLKESLELYHPNRAETCGYIQNILEGILTKSSLTVTQIFDQFTEDIKSSKEKMSGDNQLEDYIRLRYVDVLNDIDAEYYLFKNLWSLVFKSSNQSCEENRDANFRILVYLYQRRTSEFNEKITSDGMYYSTHTVDSYYERLVMFLNFYPAMFHSFASDMQMRIQATIDSGLLGVIALYNCNGISDIRKKIFSAYNSPKFCVPLRYVKYLYDYCFHTLGECVALEFACDMYVVSHCYDDADFFYDHFIAPNLKKFSLQQLEQIVKGINQNSQLHDRKRARETNTRIVARILELNKDFDITSYEYVSVYATE